MLLALWQEQAQMHADTRRKNGHGGFAGLPLLQQAILYAVRGMSVSPPMMILSGWRACTAIVKGA